MATNKFLIFDENGSNIMTDSEYQAATQRIGGVLPGLAEPTMHNKLYRQTSIMAAAIGRVLAQYNLDAPDDDLATLANNIKSLFCFNVLDAYPVGAIYISASAVNPSQLFGGTWEQVQGKFLLSASANYPAGTTGGEASHTLTTSEMPSHTHGVNIYSSGSHIHSGSANGAGGHTHTRGTMNITGSTLSNDGDRAYSPYALGYIGENNDLYSRGAFYISSNDGRVSVIHGINGSNTDRTDGILSFDAARNWTGETSNSGYHSHTLNVNAGGEHSHTAIVANTGGNAPHNNMPPYLSVYVWKRTA